MKMWRSLLSGLVVSVLLLSQIDLDIEAQITIGYELPPVPSYVILAPQKVRPNELLQTSVSVITMLYKQLTFRLAIKMNDTEHCNVVETFKAPGTRILQMKVPPNADEGHYWFHVRGSIYPDGAILFENRTRIGYQRKMFSMFIQTSKPVYHQSQVVRFRIIPVEPNLMPVYGTLFSVEVADPSGITVRRWLNPMTNAGGIIELSFALCDQPREGDWKILARHERFVQEKKFRVVEYWASRFDVNVSLPVRISEQGFGVYGLIQANHTAGIPVIGNASIIMELRDPKQNRFTDPPLKTFTRTVKVFEGRADFLFTMWELRDAISPATLNNVEVYVNVTVMDWFLMIERQGFAKSFIYDATPKVQFLGGMVRPFKPGMPFTSYLVVYQPDGTQVFYTQNRAVRMSIFCHDSNPVGNPESIPVPDDGIVRYTFVPKPGALDCPYYRLYAAYEDDKKQQLSFTEQRIYPYQSESNTYMQITTSTEYPAVNEYMVFNVLTNYPTSTIYYQIASSGNIVFADQLDLPQAVMSRTFSVALSRDMAPVARLVAFFVKPDGEVVSDSLTFFVNITKLNNVNVRFNRGKDLNMDTIEVKAASDPGSYMAFSAIHYTLYTHGGASILQEVDLIDELYTYENHAQAPFNFTWYHDLEYVQRVYLPSPSIGSDTNSTFNTSGLILFTDANFTKVNFWHDCNETLDAARAFPCYTRLGGKLCYSRMERCNGVWDCLTGADELNCPQNSSYNELGQDLLSSYNLHYFTWDDGAWMWQSHWVKPNGEVEFAVSLPKIDTSWVVGAFAVDRQNGFSIMTKPAKFSGSRRFYIVVECPEEAFWGEQIGVRVALFNYWNYWTEALLEVRRSDEYRIVRVGWRGAVSAYSPKVITNETVHTLVYLEAGESRYVHIPIIPNTPYHNTTFTVCAFTFIGGNCETRTISVKMNGVMNYYHSGYLLDLTSSAAMLAKTFKISVPQLYLEPERRQHRYVPGSPTGRISVVGDVIGPGLSKEHEYVTVDDLMRLQYGAAENVIFELGYNVQLLLYLRSVDAERSTAVLYSGLDYANVVLQRVMGYYNDTVGGFANFRDDLTKPRVLATAHALFSLLQAKVVDWDRYLYIPDDLINDCIHFLRSKQFLAVDRNNPTRNESVLSGSFEVEDVLDTRFNPTIDPKVGDVLVQEAHRRVPITSMVVLGLKYRGENIKGDIDNFAPLIVNDAMEFLQKHVLNLKDIFSKVIATYALSLGSDKNSVPGTISEAIKQIESQFRRADSLYLSNTFVPPPATDSDSTSTLLLNPKLEWPNDGYSVASTSINFIMRMERGDWGSQLNESLQTVIWLAGMRDHVGAFASTFDSLMAMTALKDFAIKDKNRHLYKLRVGTSCTSLGNATYPSNFVPANYSVEESIIIPAWDVWGYVEQRTEGTGRLLLQLDITKNVEYAEFMKRPYNPLAPGGGKAQEPLDSFRVKCNIETTGRNASTIYWTACATWVGHLGPVEFAWNQSGMAVIEVHMPTGYVVMNDYLRELVVNKTVPNLQYARFRPGRVHLFFSEIGQEETCVRFRGDRFYPVANATIQYLCSVYDYYEPGRYNHSLYDLIPLATQHICNVCGSYQCPYCPYYNAARAVLRAGSPLVLLLLVLLVPLLRWRGFPAVAANGEAAMGAHRRSILDWLL